MQDAAGNLTQYFYDNEGRLIRTIYPDNYMVTNTYSFGGLLDNKTDSAGTSTFYYYSTQGLLSSRVDNLIAGRSPHSHLTMKIALSTASMSMEFPSQKRTTCSGVLPAEVTLTAGSRRSPTPRASWR